MRNCVALAGLLLFGMTGSARAETCTFPAHDVEWREICSLSTGAFSGCSCDATHDDFVVPGGSRVRIAPGDSVRFADGSSGGVTIEAGGSLTLDRSDSGPSGELVVGAGGVVTRAGGGFSAWGSCRTFERYTSHRATIPRCTRGDAFFVGDVLPCDGDCDATPHLTTLVWTEARYGTDGSAQGWQQSRLDDVLRDPSFGPGSSVCFLNAWPDSDAASGELGNCYDIDAVRAPAPGTGMQDMELVLDVRQGIETNALVNPIGRRSTFAVSLATGETLESGERVLQVDGSAIGADCVRTGSTRAPCDPLPNEDTDYLGWIRFDESGSPGCALGLDCSPSEAVYRISAFEDGGPGQPDSIRLVSVNGFVAPDPGSPPGAGTVAWVGLPNGISAGDRFHVIDWAPVHCAASRIDSATCPFVARSGSSLAYRYLLLDRMLSPLLHSDPQLAEVLWVRDAQQDETGASAYLRIGGDAAPVLDTIMVTGVDNDAVGSDDMHCIALLGTDRAFDLSDITCRYHNDDSIWDFTGAVPQVSSTRTIETHGVFRVEGQGDAPDTAQGILDCGTESPLMTGTIRNPLVVGWNVNGNGIGGLVRNCPSGLRVEDPFVVGGSTAWDEATEAEFVNATMVGTRIVGPAAPVASGENWVVRDVVGVGSATFLPASGTTRNAFIKDSVMNGAPEKYVVLRGGSPGQEVSGIWLENSGFSTQDSLGFADFDVDDLTLEKIGISVDVGLSFGTRGLFHRSATNGPASQGSRHGRIFVRRFHGNHAYTGDGSWEPGVAPTGPICFGSRAEDEFEPGVRASLEQAGFEVYERVAEFGSEQASLGCGPDLGDAAPGIHVRTLNHRILGDEPDYAGREVVPPRGCGLLGLETLPAVVLGLRRRLRRRASRPPAG